MGDRMSEITGKVKAGVGGLLGNTRLVAEGRVQASAARARRKVKGALRQAGGAVQEGLGKLTGDLLTQARGTATKLRGKADQTG